MLWTGSLSPLLGAAIFVAVTGLYLASLLGSRKRRRRDADPSVSPVGEDRTALEALDELLATAPPIPMTDWVRVDPRRAKPLVDAVRVAAVEAKLRDQVDELTRVILEGRPIPFTDELRVDRRRAQRLLEALRSTV